MASHAASGHEVQGDIWSGGQEPFKASYGKLYMWYFLLSDAFTFAGFLIAYGSLRFTMPTWPSPDFVFAAFPGLSGHWPLLFVTVMTFILIASSVTMVRAVQEGQLGNKRGVIFWMFLTILGGAAFLGCQAFEWTTLIKGENMSVTQNPFGRHTADGIYTDQQAKDKPEEATFKAGDNYLIHAHAHVNPETGKEEMQFDQRPFKTTAGEVGKQAFGPIAFGSLFFFITGFHGFHVFSGVVFLTVIMLNVMSGLYQNRGNHYEMVEKIGLYWHFVDLVWVFVFLAFYLL